MPERVKIIECPRDAWQGLSRLIPTSEKVEYLQCLMRAGFRHIDAVSFVSPSYVPQMADSEQVMSMLNMGRSQDEVEIIGIVVNEQGMKRALSLPGVTTLGYPHSISATFLSRNAHVTQAESRLRVEKIKQTAEAHDRDLVIYISMAFGNPYGESWAPALVAEEVSWLGRLGVRKVSLADTAGKASSEDIAQVLAAVGSSVTTLGTSHKLEIGVHMHSRSDGAVEKVVAAYESGCRRFDSVVSGLGGCPFAGDELIGNIPTELVIATLSSRGILTDIEAASLGPAIEATRAIRSRYAQ